MSDGRIERTIGDRMKVFKEFVSLFESDEEVE